MLNHRDRVQKKKSLNARIAIQSSCYELILTTSRDSLSFTISNGAGMSMSEVLDSDEGFLYSLQGGEKSLSNGA